MEAQTTATRAQQKMIKKLGLENQVSLNLPPKEVDSRIGSLLFDGLIDSETFAEYWASNARQRQSYVPTIWSTLTSNFKSWYYQN